MSTYGTIQGALDHTRIMVGRIYCSTFGHKWTSQSEGCKRWDTCSCCKHSSTPYFVHNLTGFRYVSPDYCDQVGVCECGYKGPVVVHEFGEWDVASRVCRRCRHTEYSEQYLWDQYASRPGGQGNSDWWDFGKWQRYNTPSCDCRYCQSETSYHRETQVGHST